MQTLFIIILDGLKYKERINLIITESNRRRKKKIRNIGKFLENRKSGLKTSSLAVRYKMLEDTVRLRVNIIINFPYPNTS